MILTRRKLTLSADAWSEQSQVDQSPTRSENPVPRNLKKCAFFLSWEIENFDFSNIDSGCVPDVFTLLETPETSP